MISHLFFANDSLLFIETIIPSAQQVVPLLSQYEKASEQKINRGKYTMVFSPNVADVVKEDIFQVWFHKKYLGLPTFCGWDKTHAFSHLK